MTPPRRLVVSAAAAVLLAVAPLPPARADEAPAPTAVSTALAAPGVSTAALPSNLSVALVEVETGDLLAGRDVGTRRPIASTIKLLTALTVVDVLAPGSVVVVGPEAAAVGGSSYGLREGEQRSVEDLLAGLLLRSGNDAAVALAVAISGSEEAFTHAMSAVLEQLGIDARPASASGLEEGDALSAAELATVARAALAEPRIRSLVGVPAAVLPSGRTVENRNRFLDDLPGATGLKTGFTNAAGYTLAASAERDGRELVAIVLGAVDDEQRRAAAARMLEDGFTRTRRVELASTVELRQASGPVRYAATPLPSTVAVDAEVAFGWDRTFRPEGGPDAVAVLVEGEAVTRRPVERHDGRAVTGSVGLGAALVDGVYAALRTAALPGSAGEGLR